MHRIKILRENKLSFRDRIFYFHCTILSVKTVEFVSDMKSHILKSGCR